MPQPIDPSSELARVSQAERVQSLADRAALNAQLRASGEMAEKDRVVEQQVRQTHQKDERVEEEEAKQRNPYAGQRKKRKREEGIAANVFYDSHERPEIVDDDDNHSLDITI